MILCRISDVAPLVPPLDVAVSGVSLLPYCHLELPESSYLTLKDSSSMDCLAVVRPNKELGTSSIDPSTKVIEFAAKGNCGRIIKYGTTSSTGTHG